MSYSLPNFGVNRCFFGVVVVVVVNAGAGISADVMDVIVPP
jgi:hypothetical protein